MCDLSRLFTSRTLLSCYCALPLTYERELKSILVVKIDDGQRPHLLKTELRAVFPKYAVKGEPQSLISRPTRPVMTVLSHKGGMYRVDVGDELEPLRVTGVNKSDWEWHTLSLVSKFRPLTVTHHDHDFRLTSKIRELVRVDEPGVLKPDVCHC